MKKSPCSSTDFKGLYQSLTITKERRYDQVCRSRWDIDFPQIAFLGEHQVQTTCLSGNLKKVSSSWGGGGVVLGSGPLPLLSTPKEGKHDAVECATFYSGVC